MEKETKKYRNKMCIDKGIYEEKCDDFWSKMDSGYFKNGKHSDEYITFYKPDKFAEQIKKQHHFICIEELIETENCEKWIYSNLQKDSNFVINWYKKQELLKRRKIQRCIDDKNSIECWDSNIDEIKKSSYLKGQKDGYYEGKYLKL